jgi:RNA-directed DNA polymerase
MNKRQTPFELLCEMPALVSAWKQVRANRGAAGVDLTTIAEFERDLLRNLQELAARLREGRYTAAPLRTFEMRKANGKTRTLGIFTVEDRIVQRAALDALEPLWEPVFLDCSFGFRPNRNVEMAVKRVLDYRAAGDAYLVDADIADCFGSLDHNLAMELVGRRVRDKRMLNLIRMWLDAGQVLPDSSRVGAAGVPVVERLTDYATGAVNDAITHLLDERGFGAGFGGYGAPYGAYGSSAYDEATVNANEGDVAAEMRRAARKEAFKRLGRDAALLGLTYAGRTRRLFSPATLAIAGAAVMATAAYPAASRLIRQYRSRSPGVGAVQGSALSPLLANIVLHEFDVAMAGAGLHLVRFADDWVITCRDAERAQSALEAAERRLAELKLRINPEKTRIISFEQGLEFLGYKFDRFRLTATPAPTSTQQTIRVLMRQAGAKAAPAVTGFGKKAVNRAKAGAQRVAGWFKK